MADEIEVDCVKLIDGKLSVRVDGSEVYVLPPRGVCSAEDIGNAVRKVVQMLMEEDEGW